MKEITKWLDAKKTRPDGSEAHIPTRWAAMEVGVEKALAKDATTLASSDKRTLVVFDARTEHLSKPVIKALRDQGLQVHTHVTADYHDGSPPSADDVRVERVYQDLLKYEVPFAVSVGSGTINDLTKSAAFQKGIPYLSYATAASMNGYTSGIAALYVKGLKSTVPVAPPVGVYADPEVIATADPIMNLAGLGDLCSKPFAGADASIAALLQGQTPWSLPSEMVEDVFQSSLEQAEAIGQNKPEAVAELMKALWISGFSMTLAGSSAPASGGEHLWSHRLDMEQHDAHLPPVALHGTQVGVACGLVRDLFEKVGALEQGFVKEQLAKAPSEPNPEGDDFGKWLRGRHPELSEGSMAAVEKEAAKKYHRATREQLRAQLVEVWGQARVILLQARDHADRITLALQRSKAPLTPQDIGITQERSDRTLRVCRDIRNRLTILDLAADLLDNS